MPPTESYYSRPFKYTDRHNLLLAYRHIYFFKKLCYPTLTHSKQTTQNFHSILKQDSHQHCVIQRPFNSGTEWTLREVMFQTQ